MFKRILVPLDGSETAQTILPYLKPLARCANAELLLLRVPVHPVYEYLATDPIVAVESRASAEVEATRYLEQVQAALRAEGLQASTHVGSGPVGETIVEMAQRLGADLIAMSTHGRSGLSRWMLGSVAEQVVRSTRLPVLLFRPEPQPQSDRGAYG